MSQANVAVQGARAGVRSLLRRIPAFRLNMNPVLGRELRSRARSWKFSLVVTAYLVGLGLVAFGSLFLMTRQLRYGGVIGPDAGVQIYAVLAIVQLVLIALVAPSLTVGAISGERERQTMDLLLVTRQSATSIIIGKLLASLAFILLLVVASMPVFSIIFLFGGINLKAMGLTFLIYAATTLTLGAVGLLTSTLFRRTALSTVLAYAVVGFLFVGTVIYVGFRMAMPGAPYGPVRPVPGANPGVGLIPWMLFANPMVALLSVLPGYGGVGGEFTRILYEIYMRGVTVWGPTGPIRPPKMPEPWVAFLWINLGLFALSVITSILLLTPVKPWVRWRAAWRRRREARRAPALAGDAGMGDAGAGAGGGANESV